MSITPPENYTYATVVFRALKQVLDTADVDRYPDVEPATGTITFTPNARYFKNLAMPATFVPPANGYVGTLNASGYMVDHLNNLGVVLLAPDSPDISPAGWTYRVTMVISGQTLPTFDLTVTGGETIDLTTVMPAATSAGAVVIVSEASAAAAAASAAEAAASAASIEGSVDQAVEDYLAANPVSGLPDGGSTAQMIRKVSSADQDVAWVTIVKSDVGLSNVDNTSDANKPVSTAQQTALNLKANLASPTFTGTVSGITKSMVGLGSVDNTADVSKPVSTAQQTALDLKANLASPTFTGTVSGVTKTHVGLSNVDNTSDTAKPVSSAQQTALDAKLPSASARPVIRALTSTTWPSRASSIPTGYSGTVEYDGTAFTTVTEPTDRQGGDWLVDRQP